MLIELIWFFFLYFNAWRSFSLCFECRKRPDFMLFNMHFPRAALIKTKPPKCYFFYCHLSQVLSIHSLHDFSLYETLRKRFALFFAVTYTTMWVQSSAIKKPVTIERLKMHGSQQSHWRVAQEYNQISEKFLEREKSKRPSLSSAWKSFWHGEASGLASGLTDHHFSFHVLLREVIAIGRQKKDSSI